jgi:TrmH family RNA methyltransferase
MAPSPALSARDPRVVRAAGLLRAPGTGGLVALDGPELVEAALAEGLAVEELLAADPGAWAGRAGGAPVAAAGPDALRALGALGQPATVVAVVRLPAPPPAGLPAGAVVLAGVGDAGNVGSILRSAAALGAPRAVLAGACADPWSRRALRAAMGASLRRGLVARAGSLAEVAAWPGRPPLAAAVAAGGVAAAALPPGTAIVLGAEREGLSAAERALCEHAVTIDAPGFESLNVAAAAAILLHAVRG